MLVWILGPKSLERASVLHQLNGVGTQRHHIVPIGELNGVSIALTARVNLFLKHGLVSRTYSKKSPVMASNFGSKSKFSTIMSPFILGVKLTVLPVEKFFHFSKTCPSGSPKQTLEPNFEARVQGYMAAHTKMMERFKKDIFKQREEINDRMAMMFGLLRELTSSRTLEKVLVREESSNPITKSINDISLIKMEKENGIKGDEVAKWNVMRLNELQALEPNESPDKEEETEEGTDDRSVESVKEELTGVETKVEALVETPSRLTDKEPVGTDVRLSIASHSYIYPLGISEDVLIDIAGYVKIFVKVPALPSELEKNAEDDLDLITPKNTVSKMILEWEERIKNHQEKEMEFNQWRSTVFENKGSISKNEGCERKYALEILERTCMLNRNPCRTPAVTESKLDASGPLVSDPNLYRSLAGAFWLSNQALLATTLAKPRYSAFALEWERVA
nr:ribonuclease H-like domain-containing protein [Tanacetum cinerariifolium]